MNSFQTGETYEITGRSLVLFVLEPESKRSVALRRAIEGFRQMAERPIPMATPESGPETERALADAPRNDASVNHPPGVLRVMLQLRSNGSRWPLAQFGQPVRGNADICHSPKGHIMSETTKSAETAKGRRIRRPDASQASIDAAGKAAKEAI